MSAPPLTHDTKVAVAVMIGVAAWVLVIVFTATAPFGTPRAKVASTICAAFLSGLLISAACIVQLAS